MTQNHKTISKILIANRGEIACRVIRTAKERGITTVAVYSDADKRALHVQLADEAVHIGGSASNESYLRIDAIIDAVAETGADAVHPGFGFLSENAAFATALAQAGIVFIGPGVRAIKAMGDKIESKKLAQQAGVTVVPGHPEAIPTAEQALQIAKQVGCPVMLKASAGGGGKGMRVANNLEQVVEGFNSARNEARTAFGDDRIFIEKFIEQPRHIEIQLIADAHGNCLYLGERECSIQRRHQKVIEEAPSSFISATTRQAMGEQAVALAKAVDYVSAGTVEFIVDANEQFYFLEMNTRLQVEHPVTECITGVDLVSLMIDVAEGNALQLTQADIKLDGWAFEARIYAEDVDRGFLPSTGRITHYSPPLTLADIRVDTGITAGGEIPLFYDPMIAKLVSWAPTRQQAIELMLQALDHYRIEGVQNNIAFLSALFAHPALQAGNLTTGFIEDHFKQGFNSRQFETPLLDKLPLVAAWLETRQNQRNYKQTSAHTHAQNLPLFVKDAMQTHSISSDAQASVHSLWNPGEWLFEGKVGNDEMTVKVTRTDNAWRLSHRGSVREYSVFEPHVEPLLALMPKKQSRDLSRLLLSPMPGLLMKVLVEPGDSVSIGQDLVVIEAMKMENTLTSEVNGTIKKLVAQVGDSLAVDDVIAEFE